MGAARGRAVGQTNDEGEDTETQRGQTAGCRRAMAHRTALTRGDQAAIEFPVIGEQWMGLDQLGGNSRTSTWGSSCLPAAGASSPP
jgi:hypothetical protein